MQLTSPVSFNAQLPASCWFVHFRKSHSLGHEKENEKQCRGKHNLKNQMRAAGTGYDSIAICARVFSLPCIVSHCLLRWTQKAR